MVPACAAFGDIDPGFPPSQGREGGESPEVASPMR